MIDMKTDIGGISVEEYLRNQIESLDVNSQFKLRDICDERFNDKDISELGKQFAKYVSKNEYFVIERIGDSEPALYLKKEKGSPFQKVDRL